jgi:uncharacterized protein YggU (UPF0235/DUF167 family)
MRVTVRVKPGASRTKVGGQYGEISPEHGGVLIVFVAQRPVDGAATEGVLRAVARAFNLRRADVELALPAWEPLRAPRCSSYRVTKRV